MDYQTNPGFVTDERHETELFYLGADGSCKRLYARSEALGLVNYGPTLAGTYTYVPTSGNPNEATLTISFPTVPQYYGGKLQFGSDTRGTLDLGSGAIGTETFSLLSSSPNSFLINVSNRVTLRPSESAITGFVVGGNSSRLVLIRGVGPGLAQFGVNPVSAMPTLNLFSGAALTASGLQWESFTGYDPAAMSWIFNLVGAFSVQTGSKDVVYFGALNPGAYTAQVSDSTTGAAGASALVEVYILPYSG